MSAASEPRTDWSREESERRLGAGLMALIGQMVAAAPSPTPERVERVRRIFAPTVAQIYAEQAGAVTSDAAKPAA